MTMLKRNASMCTAMIVLAVAASLGLLNLSARGDDGMVAPPSTPESIEAGKVLFFEYCSGCHGRRADGRGPQSMNLVPRPQNLRNGPFVQYLTDARMFASISGGVRGTAMPPFEMTLAPEKRYQVMHYIRSLTADDTLTVTNAPAHQPVAHDARNPVAATPEALAVGKRVFLNYCANCHGQKADGKGVLAPNLIPMPRNLVAVVSWGEKPFIDYLADSRVYESITNGVPGTSMAPWISVLNDEERWKLVLFLRDQAASELKRTEHPDEATGKTGDEQVQH
jgi:mono/diheme cytochrome c family protein